MLNKNCENLLQLLFKKVLVPQSYRKTHLKFMRNIEKCKITSDTKSIMYFGLKIWRMKSSRFTPMFYEIYD